MRHQKLKLKNNNNNNTRLSIKTILIALILLKCNKEVESFNAQLQPRHFAGEQITTPRRLETADCPYLYLK